MKKIIIAATLVLGMTTMSFAQVSLAKNNSNQHPGKMAIAKKDKPAGTAQPAAPVAKTSPASTGNAAGTVSKTNHKATGEKMKAKNTAPGLKNKMIGKKNKAAKKARKANKKTAQPVKTGQ